MLLRTRMDKTWKIFKNKVEILKIKKYDNWILDAIEELNKIRLSCKKN